MARSIYVLPIVTARDNGQSIFLCAVVQGQTQGQLDKLQEEPNYWTFLTGATVATLPISRSASVPAFCTLSLLRTAPKLLRGGLCAWLGRVHQKSVDELDRLSGGQRKC